MPNQTLDLSVVIVSWNVRELLKACLQSVYDTVQGLRFEVFVVDNASHDGSPQMVERFFPDAHLIANGDNRGFGPANNQALRLATGRYVLLLNPDTTVPPGVIAEMVDSVDPNSWCAHVRVDENHLRNRHSERSEESPPCIGRLLAPLGVTKIGSTETLWSVTHALAWSGRSSCSETVGCS